MHVLHTDIDSFLIKNNQNTHHSNSLPIKEILIPTSAFIFSMSEYFFYKRPWLLQILLFSLCNYCKLCIRYHGLYFFHSIRGAANIRGLLLKKVIVAASDIECTFRMYLGKYLRNLWTQVYSGKYALLKSIHINQQLIQKSAAQTEFIYAANAIALSEPHWRFCILNRITHLYLLYSVTWTTVTKYIGVYSLENGRVENVSKKLINGKKDGI